MKTKIIHVVDVSNFMNRAYYASDKELSAPDGTPTGALKTFLNMVNKLIAANSDDYFIFPFDCPRKKSWRARYTKDSKTLDSYKGDRPVDEDKSKALSAQLKLARDILQAGGYLCPITKSFEADDLIGTIAKRFGRLGYKVIIYSRDKDFVQCLNSFVTIVRQAQANSAEQIITAQNAHEFYVKPKQMIDFLTMVGDSSDCVAGIKGIGEKTAKTILEKYGSIDAARDQSFPRFEKLSNEFFEDTRMLVTIDTNAPNVPKHIKEFRPPVKEKVLKRIKKELRFNYLISGV